MTSLIIPCYQEREGIPLLCQRLALLMPDLRDEAEVIFVDDGSTDGTAEAIREHAGRLPHRLLSHGENRGISAALRTGFEAARGEEVVTLDSDCTYDPLDVPRLLARLREGFDLVTASPYHPEGRVDGVVEWRLFLSRGLSRLYWMVLPLRLHTYTSCFRAARRDVALAIRTVDPGFLGVAEFLVEGILDGYRVAEVPATLRTRRHGQSKIRVLRVIRAHLSYLGSLVARRLRNRLSNSPHRNLPGRGHSNQDAM